MYSSKRLFSARFFSSILLLIFSAAIFAQAENRRLTFAVIGDSGTGKKEQFAIGQQMNRTREKRPYEFVLMLGDNIYPNGKAKHFSKKFEQPYAELLTAGVKFYASLGNHDTRSGTMAQVTYDKFNMGGRRYYSFVQENGLAEFFALDSTDMNAQQIAWLEKSLAVSTAQWKIAFFHHPLYSSGKRHGSDRKLRKICEPIFIRSGVNVVFSGHDHMYERVHPQVGIAYFVEGASGALRKNGIRKKSELTAASNAIEQSFLFVQITPENVQVEALNASGAIFDSVIIPKPTKKP